MQRYLASFIEQCKSKKIDGNKKSAAVAQAKVDMMFTLSCAITDADPPDPLPETGWDSIATNKLSYQSFGSI